jgi:hypothetical protein
VDVDPFNPRHADRLTGNNRLPPIATVEAVSTEAGPLKRLPLTAALLTLMIVWLASPLVWLYAVGQVGPDSGTEPTPGQERALLIVNVCTLAYVLIAPAVVLWVAWRTRRVVVGWLTAAAVVIAVLTAGGILIAAG